MTTKQDALSIEPPALADVTAPVSDVFNQYGPYFDQIYREQEFFLGSSFQLDQSDPPETLVPLYSSLPADGHESTASIGAIGSPSIEGISLVDLFGSEIRTPITFQGEIQEPPQDVLFSPTLFPADGPANNEESPFDFFVNHLEPPCILPFDHVTWKIVSRYIAEVGAHVTVVAASITAVEALYRAILSEQDTTEARSLYYAAKSIYERSLADESQDFHTTLIATLLLCIFEITTQHDTAPTTNHARGAFTDRLERWSRQGNWPPVSRRIVAWLRILHASAMHLGNRGILSDKVSRLFPNDRVDTHSLLFLDPCPTPLTCLCEALNKPLFDFYEAVQVISIEISRLNRHHRPRGVPSEEEQVQAIFRELVGRLRSLWTNRTGLLRLQPRELRSKLSVDIAEPIIRMVGLCTAIYHAAHVDLRRSHGQPALASDESKAAMQEIRDVVDGDYNSITNGKVDSGFLWPIFVCALESTLRQEAQWAVERLGQINNKVCHSDLVARLASEITEQQFQQGKRVDVRYFCLEKYGSLPPYM